VVCLDRDRHAKLINEVREAGARLKLIAHGDIAGGLDPAMATTGIDVLMGVGGAPEAVVTACALKCLGGDMQCKLWPRNDEDRRQGEARGLDFNRVLQLDDLCAGNDIFFAATGVTDGDLLRGVRYVRHGATTQSLAMRARSGTVRLIEATHNLDKLSQFTAVPYRQSAK
jgi:fructose-1,6-bisphosphatase II